MTEKMKADERFLAIDARYRQNYENAADFNPENMTAYGGMSGTGSDMRRNGSAGTI